MSMQVDRINQVQLQWSPNYVNPNSREYRILADEANKAVRILFKQNNNKQNNNKQNNNKQNNNK